MSEFRYPVAPQGVFVTANGEGYFSGVPQVFVRLAGCPLNCPQCDTNYSVAEHATAVEIARRVADLAGGMIDWTWVTGGEPAVYDLSPLLKELRRIPGMRQALATSGIKPVQEGRAYGGWDFLSVSPHAFDASWVQRRGSQLNLVPGLNGLSLADVPELPAETFPYRYVTPCEGLRNVAECWEWVQRHPGWRLGWQAHKYHWRMA